MPGAVVSTLVALVSVAWTTGASLSVPRTEVAAAVLDGKIVAVGGFLASGANSRRLDAYDPVRDRWARVTNLPVSVDHAAAASWRGRLVVVGGYGADRQPLRAAFLYDGRRWRRLPPRNPGPRRSSPARPSGRSR